MPATHLRSLTSLRFFAAMLVVLFHASLQSSPTWEIATPLRFGYLGVTFFFVLSGFVLVWSAGPSDGAIAFYRRRFARVWPVHGLTLAVAVILASTSAIVVRGPEWSLPVNALLLQAWSPDPDVRFGFNIVSWSLSAEVFFYALFPFLLVWARRSGPAVTIGYGVAWLVLGGLLADLSGHPWWADGLPAYRIGEFVVGMGLGLLARSAAPRVRPLTGILVLTLCYGADLALNRITAGGLTDRPWLAALIVLPGVALVLVAFAGQDISRRSSWLGHPVLVRLGQWSFALYMVHDLVLRTARPAMLAHVWLVPVMIIVSVVLSGVVFECFERPVERRLRGRSKPAAQLEPMGS